MAPFLVLSFEQLVSKNDKYEVWKMAVVIIPQEFKTALAMVIAFSNHEIACLAYIQRSEIVLLFLFCFDLDL